MVLVVAALVAAVLIAPIGEELILGTTPTARPSGAPLGPARQGILDAGRSAPAVGEPTPEISFTTFDGVPIELHGRNRPVVLMFFGDPCADCDGEMGRLAVMATITADETWVAALAAPAAVEVQSAYADSGAAELMYGGTDEGGAIAGAFGVDRFPATVVVDAGGKVAAVWTRSVPSAVVLALVESL